METCIWHQYNLCYFIYGLKKNACIEVNNANSQCFFVEDTNSTLCCITWMVCPDQIVAIKLYIFVSFCDWGIKKCLRYTNKIIFLIKKIMLIAIKKSWKCPPLWCILFDPPKIRHKSEVETLKQLSDHEPYTRRECVELFGLPT